MLKLSPDKRLPEEPFEYAQMHFYEHVGDRKK